MTKEHVDYSDKLEEALGRAMLRRAKEEGHRKRLPRNNTKHHVPAPSRVRQEIMDFFSNHPDSASTNTLLNHVDSKPPNLRRVCRDMVKEGLLRSERTADGCVFTFIGQVS